MSCLHAPLMASLQNLPRSVIKMSDPCHGRRQHPTMSAEQNQKAAAAARVKRAQIDRKDNLHPFEGRLLKHDSVFQQSFSVMAYEVGQGLTITVEALMNYMKETSINHPKNIERDVGFGCTPEMHRRNLMWASRSTQMSFHSYPSWGDIIDANTWFSVSKRGLRREWLLRDASTGETVLKAASLFVLMNMSTRKLSMFPDEILSELAPHTRNCEPIIHFDEKKLRRMDVSAADHVRENIMPMWNDIDWNSHVSNVKYINWLIEGVPRPIPEKNVLDEICLEYRRECGRDSKVQSLSARVKDEIEFEHLLLLQDGTETARARTKWRPRLEPPSQVRPTTLTHDETNG